MRNLWIMEQVLLILARNYALLVVFEYVHSILLELVVVFLWTCIYCLFLNVLLVHAVPFEEDDKDPSIWFLDHDYHGSMFSMFRRINGITTLVSRLEF